MRISPQRTFSTAAALAAALLLCSLMLPTLAACPPGQTPYHCKPEGAACTPRKKSECESPYKCDQATRVCVPRSTAAPNPDPSNEDTPGPGHTVPAIPIDTPKCILPVSPFEVRTGTPKNHRDRHPGSTKYKDISAVDLVVAKAGQAVYAVQDGTLSTGGAFAISSGSPNKWGWSFEITSDDGQHFFYTHVNDPLAPGIQAGARVKKGDLLGWVAQAPKENQPSLLHFAYQEGHPCTYLQGCRGKDGQAPNDFGKCWE